MNKKIIKTLVAFILILLTSMLTNNSKVMAKWYSVGDSVTIENEDGTYSYTTLNSYYVPKDYFCMEHGQKTSISYVYKNSDKLTDAQAYIFSTSYNQYIKQTAYWVNKGQDVSGDSAISASTKTTASSLSTTAQNYATKISTIEEKLELTSSSEKIEGVKYSNTEYGIGKFKLTGNDGNLNDICSGISRMYLKKKDGTIEEVKKWVDANTSVSYTCKYYGTNSYDSSCLPGKNTEFYVVASELADNYTNLYIEYSYVTGGTYDKYMNNGPELNWEGYWYQPIMKPHPGNDKLEVDIEIDVEKPIEIDIKLTKKSHYDKDKKLANAQFSFMVLSSGVNRPYSDFISNSAERLKELEEATYIDVGLDQPTTDGNGKLEIKNINAKNILDAYGINNKEYFVIRVTETEAPTGYVKVDPMYILIKMNDDRDGIEDVIKLDSQSNYVYIEISGDPNNIVIELEVEDKQGYDIKIIKQDARTGDKIEGIMFNIGTLMPVANDVVSYESINYDDAKEYSRKIVGTYEPSLSGGGWRSNSNGSYNGLGYHIETDGYGKIEKTATFYRGNDESVKKLSDVQLGYILLRIEEVLPEEYVELYEKVGLFFIVVKVETDPSTGLFKTTDAKVLCAPEDEGYITAEVNEVTKKIIINVKDEPKEDFFNFEMFKYDKDSGAALEGAEFEVKITNEEGSPVEEGTYNIKTDTNGRSLITGIKILDTGNFYVEVKETKAPEGYKTQYGSCNRRIRVKEVDGTFVLEEDHYSFESAGSFAWDITSNKIKFSLSNEKKGERKVNLFLYKYDKDKADDPESDIYDALLEGAKFDITIKGGGIDSTFTKTSDNNGQIEIEDLIFKSGGPVNITIEEIEAPSGYQKIDPYEITIELEYFEANEYYNECYRPKDYGDGIQFDGTNEYQTDEYSIRIAIPNKPKLSRSVNLSVLKYDKERAAEAEDKYTGMIQSALAGAEFEIAIEGGGLSKTARYTTNDRGAINIEDLKITDAGDIRVTITEIKAPIRYGKIDPVTIIIKTKYVPEDDMYAPGYVFVTEENINNVGISGDDIGVEKWIWDGREGEIYIPNEKMKLNLTLNKFDGRTREVLSGAQFTIKLNGTDVVDPSGNKVFTINNGFLTIEEIEIPDPDNVVLTLTEVATPQYYHNIGTITITGKVIDDADRFELEVSNIDYDTSKTNSEVRATCEANTLNLTVDIPNKRETIKLNGYVWEDIKKGKETTANGAKDNDESGIQGIQVNLYRYVANASGGYSSEWQKTTMTDTNGFYEFDEIDKGRGYEYYVEFVYNGYNYQHTTYTPYQTGVTNTSNSTEKYKSFNGIRGRTELNAQFATIDSSSVDKGINNTTATQLSYNGVDISIKANTGGNKNTASIDTDIARFGDLPANDKWEHINLGLVEREVADIALMKDVYKATVSVNGYIQDYIYSKRNDSLENDDNGNSYWEVTTRKSDASYYNEAYTREVKEADYNSALTATVTYKITIANQSEGLIAEIPSIIDYYDKEYSYNTAYIGNASGNRIADIANITTSSNAAYNILSFNGMNIKLNPSERAYIYVVLNVNKDGNKILLDESDQGKGNIAEITSYKTTYSSSAISPNNGSSYSYTEYTEGTIAGRVDIDSNPGNANPSDINTFEDDTDRAPYIKFVIGEERKTEGNVWLENRTENVGNAIIGNGIKENSESVVQGITVELIDVNTGNVAKVWDDSTNNFVDARTTTDENGNYSIGGFIPGKYYIRFTYPDGQTYKSTTYHSGGGFNADSPDVLDTADLNEGTRYSDARDLASDRQNVNSLLEEETNARREALETSSKTMRAITGQIEINVEKDPSDTSSGIRLYEVANIDFGLVERPKAQLTLNKEITNVKVVLANGSTLFDASGRATNVLWLAKTLNTVQKTGNILTSPYRGSMQMIQLTMDEELMQGATIKITYKLTVTNEGEVDYKDNKFYYLGDATGASVVKTTIGDIIDYVGASASDDSNATLNNLKFNSEDNAGWITTTANDLNAAGLISADILTDAQKYNTIVKYTFDKALTPVMSGEAVNSTSTNLVLTQTMSTDSGSDDLSYNNVAEIIRVKNDVGRKMAYSTVGNQNPNSIPGEIDEDAASVIVLPPFGQTYIYYVLGIGIAIITIAGIIIIKKKVLKK